MRKGTNNHKIQYFQFFFSVPRLLGTFLPVATFIQAYLNSASARPGL